MKVILNKKISSFDIQGYTFIPTGILSKTHRPLFVRGKLVDDILYEASFFTLGSMDIVNYDRFIYLSKVIFRNDYRFDYLNPPQGICKKMILLLEQKGIDWQ